MGDTLNPVVAVATAAAEVAATEAAEVAVVRRLTPALRDTGASSLAW